VLALIVSVLAMGQLPLIAPGDRLAWIGGALVEQEIRSGDWELELTRHMPGAKLVIRNLGWSGDTVLGEARAGFGSPADGFKALVAQTIAVKPTVIWLQYGSNEAFADPLDIAVFRAQYEKLLDALAPTKARIVLVIPPPIEIRPSPLPDVAPVNARMERVASEIQSIASARGLGVFSLQQLWADVKTPQTTNGLQLAATGYRNVAPAFAKAVGMANAPEAEILMLQEGVQEIQDKILPAPGQSRIVKVKGLKPGTYELLVNGKVIASTNHETWAAGAAMTKGPAWDQSAKLREAIVAKNMLFFHRWRPQNETYLFGFRKHEQGNNAREIPQFDPFIEKTEAEINRLSVPVKTTYQIRKVSS
jgi:lysophospholipase L1-like esterase